MLQNGKPSTGYGNLNDYFRKNDVTEEVLQGVYSEKKVSAANQKIIEAVKEGKTFNEILPLIEGRTTESIHKVAESVLVALKQAMGTQ